MDEREPYRRIIVALDGSERAEQILAYVEPLARAFGSQVRLLTALLPFEAGLLAEPPAGLGWDERAATNEALQIVDEERRGAITYVTALKDRLEANGLAVECEYPEGRPVEVIIQTAREWVADLIAMTTHGRGGIKRVLLGSVAGEVLHQAPCPVLLVRVA